MIKAVIIIRESTERQEIETQKEEAVKYAKTFGYKLDELVVVGEAGASAIKLDDRYLNNMKKVYEILDNTPSVERVIATALDRIARDEVQFFTLKNYLIAHKINLNIKNPSLTLFNPDGTVNNGMEIAMSLFATMAKQEMEIKKARFKRVKEDNAKKGKYNGGVLLYGYTVKDGYIVLDEVKSEIVRTVYNLYSTNKYSIRELREELSQRGINLTWDRLLKILSDKRYTGEDTNENKLLKNYPQIITEEIFNTCEKIRKNNIKVKSKESVNRKLALKILRCHHCGTAYGYCSGNQYMCNHKKYFKRLSAPKCEESVAVNASIMDSMLIEATQYCSLQYAKQMNEATKQEMVEKIALLEDKVIVAKKNIEKYNTSIERIYDDYYEEKISKETRDKKEAVFVAKKSNEETNLKSFLKEIKRCKEVLTDISRSKKTIIEKATILYNDIMRFESLNDKDLYDMVHKYCIDAYVEELKLGNKFFKCVLVTTILNKIMVFIWDNRDKIKGKQKYCCLNDGTLIKANATRWLGEQFVDNFAEVKKVIQPFIEKIKNK